jgi:hypothetical protein
MPPCIRNCTTRSRYPFLFHDEKDQENKCKAHCPSILVKLSGVNSVDEDGEYGAPVDGSEAPAITATYVTLKCRLDGQGSRTPTSSQTPATRPVSSTQALPPAPHAAASQLESASYPAWHRRCPRNCRPDRCSAECRSVVG